MTIVAEAIEKRATDIHLQENRQPLLRVDTELVPIEGPAVSKCDIASWLAQYGCDLPAQGEASFAFSLQDLIRCRANIFSEYAGCHAALRILYPLDRLQKDDDAELLRRLGCLQDGLILVTGPTSSGKTTTLWRIIDYLNETRRCHIITLEDPIEYILPGKKALISQRELNHHFPSFQEGVRQALRQDPDVLLVGEMRDSATMEAALTAAETGHLVAATLHTRSAAQAVTRIIGAFSTARQDELRGRLAMILQAVLSQHRFCDNNGMHIAREILLQTPAVSQLIRTGREHQLNTIIQTGAASGMRTMEQALASYRSPV